MGKKLSSLFGKKELRILMLGLDAAGKTTVLYQLKQGNNGKVQTIPTVGFNVETVRINRTCLNIWDVGGQDKIRPLWRHYYTGTQAVVFVVDSVDSERLDEARDELYRVVNDRELRNIVLLVLANKQDLVNKQDLAKKQAISLDVVCDKLKLANIRHDVRWHVQPCCATSGDGLAEGFDWMLSQLR